MSAIKLSPVPSYYSDEKVGQIYKPDFQIVRDAAKTAQLTMRQRDGLNILWVGVDLLNDFHEIEDLDGIWKPALVVPGSLLNTKIMLKTGYGLANWIDGVLNLCDKHRKDGNHIFLRNWWRDEDGNKPVPFTLITNEEVKAKRWWPTREFMITLEVMDKAHGVRIWPEHCVEGSIGAKLVPAYREFLTYLAQGRGTPIMNVYKGQLQWTEFFGGFWPNVMLPYRPDVRIKRVALETMQYYKKIVVVGQAKNYCVIETLMQMYIYYMAKGEPRFMEKVYFLIDCSSSVGDDTEAMMKYEFLQKVAGLNIVKSDEFLPV